MKTLPLASLPSARMRRLTAEARRRPDTALPPPPGPPAGLLAAGLAFAACIFTAGFIAGYLLGPLLD